MGDWERQFNLLFWFYGVIGAVVGLITFGVAFGLYKLVEAHWR